MSRIRLRLFVLMAGVVLLPCLKADGQWSESGCTAISTDEVAKVMRVDLGTLRLESTAQQQGHIRCTYKSLEKVIGATDKLTAQLSIDLFQTPGSERAERQMQGLGQPGLLVKTEDGRGSDDAVVLPEQVGLDVNREPGFAVRHKNHLVVMQMAGSMQERPAGWAYAMQAEGLKLAGAHVLGPLFPDACTVVPMAQLQTLVTLNPAALTPSASGSMSQCRLNVETESGRSGSVDINIRHHATKQDIQSEALGGDVGELAHGDDAGDQVIVPPGVRGKATGIHGDTIAILEIHNPDVTAIVDKSYAYRVQRAALQTAGATVAPTTQFGPEPRAVPLDRDASGAPGGLMAWLSGLWRGYYFLVLVPTLILGIVFGSLFLRLRNDRRLMKNGLLGVARITGVGDTGITVNNSILVRYVATVTPNNGGVPYTASITKLTSRLVAPASFIGAVQPVRIDPKNPQNVVFVNDF